MASRRPANVVAWVAHANQKTLQTQNETSVQKTKTFFRAHTYMQFSTLEAPAKAFVENAMCSTELESVGFKLLDIFDRLEKLQIARDSMTPPPPIYLTQQIEGVFARFNQNFVGIASLYKIRDIIIIMKTYRKSVFFHIGDFHPFYERVYVPLFRIFDDLEGLLSISKRDDNALGLGLADVIQRFETGQINFRKRARDEERYDLNDSESSD